MEEHSYAVLSILMQTFKKSIVNCSASGKKRGGDYHVVKAQRPIRFYHLTPPFVLSNIYPFFFNKIIKM